MARPASQGDDVTDGQVEGDEESPSRAGGVQVDLKETDEKPSKPADGKAVEAPATPPDRSAEERRWKALEGQVAATRRINEDLRRQLTTLNERLQTPKDEGVKPLPKTEVDKYDQLVADGRWQEAVDLKAETVAQRIYKQNRDTEQAQAQLRYVEERRVNALERSKQKVESRYPMLHRETGDPESIETQLFNEAIAELSHEDEQILHDPYAPELAMRRMEELAQARGVSLTRSASKTPAPVRRLGQTSMPASRGAGGATTYQLSREQKEWCDMNLGHLPEAERYKHYARFAKVAEATGGVEV